MIIYFYCGSVKSITLFTVIRQRSIRQCFFTVHTYCVLCVYPSMIFFSIMTCAAAVGLLAALRDHPIGQVFVCWALSWDFGGPAAHDSNCTEISQSVVLRKSEFGFVVLDTNIAYSLFYSILKVKPVKYGASQKLSIEYSLQMLLFLCFCHRAL